MIILFDMRNNIMVRMFKPNPPLFVVGISKTKEVAGQRLQLTLVFNDH